MQVKKKKNKKWNIFFFSILLLITKKRYLFISKDNKNNNVRPQVSECRHFLTDEATGVGGKKWEMLSSFSQMFRLMNQAKWAGIPSNQGRWLRHYFYIPTTHWVLAFHVLQLPATTENLPRAMSFLSPRLLSITGFGASFPNFFPNVGLLHGM